MASEIREAYELRINDLKQRVESLERALVEAAELLARAALTEHGTDDIDDSCLQPIADALGIDYEGLMAVTGPWVEVDEPGQPTTEQKTLAEVREALAENAQGVDSPPSDATR